MSQYNTPPNLNDVIKDLKARILTLSKSVRTAPTYTTATRPASVTQGLIIFVSDATAGSKFQGWDGSSWVSLG